MRVNLRAACYVPRTCCVLRPASCVLRRACSPWRAASLLCLILLAPRTALHAQLGSHNPAPGPQGTFAIRNARIVTVSGAEIPRGTVVISGGKITAVGADAGAARDV